MSEEVSICAGRTVTAVVVFRALRGHEQALRSAMRLNALAASSDAGFINLKVLQDVDDPRTLVYVEDWADHAALINHLKTPHVVDFQQRSALMVEHKAVRILAERSEGGNASEHG